MISVAIPFVDQHHVTRRCLEHLTGYADAWLDVILIDNGSTEPFTDWPDVRGSVTYIRHEENLGVLASLRTAIDVARCPILVHQHNDVLIHERGWDTRIVQAFSDDQKLAVCGLFGAPGVGPDGARLNPHSNMLGKEWGTHGSLHGAQLGGQHPSCVFDSLFMAWRLSAIRAIGIPEETPPHHWFDRLLTLRTIECGYHAATIGIAFDHAGSATYGAASSRFRDFALRWCVDNGIAPGDDPDLAMYLYGRRLFERDYAWRLPVTVDQEYRYRWKSIH